MKKFIFLLAFIFLIPISTASILFEDWVADGSDFEAAGHYFFAKYAYSQGKLTLKMDGTMDIMDLGDCETRDDVRFCFEDVDSEDALATKVRIKIESLEPDLSIERSFSTTSPGLDEEIIVTVTLKNNGNIKASNIEYTDAYPIGLRIFYDGNTVKWEGNIVPGTEEIFTYKIKADEIISFDSTAEVSYQFIDKEKTKKSSSVTVSVQKSFGIDDAISTEAADKNEIVTYNLTINNNHESSRLTIDNLVIDLPSSLDLVGASPEFKKGENKLTFTGTLDKKETKILFIKVKSSKVGKSTISTSADLSIAGDTFSEKLEKSFSVGLSYVLPMLNLTEKVKSNSPYDIYIAVKNYGKEEIKNVNIKVESDLFDNIEEKKSISAGDTYEIFEKKLTAPYLEEDKKYNVKVSGSYISSSGKTYTFEKSSQLTVTAPPKVIQIIRELNKEEFYPGDEIKIIIKLKNQKNIAVDIIDVSDIFPKEIRSSLMGDVTGDLEKLEANEEKKAYSYSLLVPEDYKEDEIEFKTTVNAKVDGDLVILKRIDKVKVLHEEKPEGIEEEADEEEGRIEEPSSEPEEVDEETGEIEEEKKPNVFIRMVNWIKNLFIRN